MKTTAVCPVCRAVGWHSDDLPSGFVLPVSEPCECPEKPIVVEGLHTADEVLGPRPRVRVVPSPAAAGTAAPAPSCPAASLASSALTSSGDRAAASAAMASVSRRSASA
jgi:hypothetical protein